MIITYNILYLDGFQDRQVERWGVPPQPQGSHCWDAHPRLIADLVFT